MALHFHLKNREREGKNCNYCDPTIIAVCTDKTERENRCESAVIFSSGLFYGESFLCLDNTMLLFCYIWKYHLWQPARMSLLQWRSKTVEVRALVSNSLPPVCKSTSCKIVFSCPISFFTARLWRPSKFAPVLSNYAGVQKMRVVMVFREQRGEREKKSPNRSWMLMEAEKMERVRLRRNLFFPASLCVVTREGEK